MNALVCLIACFGQFDAPDAPEVLGASMDVINLTEDRLDFLIRPRAAGAKWARTTVRAGEQANLILPLGSPPFDLRVYRFRDGAVVEEFGTDRVDLMSYAYNPAGVVRYPLNNWALASWVDGARRAIPTPVHAGEFICVAGRGEIGMFIADSSLNTGGAGAYDPSRKPRIPPRRP
jgi:hypothetical protein